jgi:hypothetical protein
MDIFGFLEILRSRSRSVYLPSPQMECNLISGVVKIGALWLLRACNPTIHPGSPADEQNTITFDLLK